MDTLYFLGSFLFHAEVAITCDSENLRHPISAFCALDFLKLIFFILLSINLNKCICRLGNYNLIY